MPSSDLQAQMATKCTEAVSEYTNAAMAAWAHGWSEVIRQWTAAMEPFLPTDPNRSKSWFKHPDHQPASTAFPALSVAWPMTTDWTAMMLPLQAVSTVHSPPTPCTPLQKYGALWPSPFPTPWAMAWPLNVYASSALVWPMALSMMAAGWPQDVAMPTAKGNAAAMDAMETANKLADATFSSYHSATGFASAQIHTKARTNKKQDKAPADVPAFPLMWPWVA